MAEKTKPAVRHVLGVPNNSVKLNPRPRCLRVLTAGNLVIKDSIGTSITYPVFAGEQLPLEADYVMATGTTATYVEWY